MATSASTSTSPISATSPSSSTSSSSAPRRKPRVSAEHTLNRVRENQRRHRARQRDHVASLELRLAETERQLGLARAEIERLKGERDVANAFVCLDVSRHFERMDSVVAAGGEGVDLFGVVGDGALLEASSMRTIGVSVADDVPLLALPLAPASASQQQPTPAKALLGPPPPCCADDIPSTTLSPPTTQDSAAASAECTSCATRPPPSPSESTTLCAQAFVLISQRNVKNLDPSLIRMWLSRGYRRAIRDGEGCRVEDGTLRGLLEYISEV